MLGSGATGKVYRFKEESQEWVEFLKPMTTARYFLSVATTQFAIIAFGGATNKTYMLENCRNITDPVLDCIYQLD